MEAKFRRSSGFLLSAPDANVWPTHQAVPTRAEFFRKSRRDDLSIMDDSQTCGPSQEAGFVCRGGDRLNRRDDRPAAFRHNNMVRPRCTRSRGAGLQRDRVPLASSWRIVNHSAGDVRQAVVPASEFHWTVMTSTIDRLSSREMTGMFERSGSLVLASDLPGSRGAVASFGGRLCRLEAGPVPAPRNRRR